MLGRLTGRLIDIVCLHAAIKLRDPIVTMYNAAGREMCRRGAHEPESVRAGQFDVMICTREGCGWSEQYLISQRKAWDHEA